jgi:hypothetical protein
MTALSPESRQTALEEFVATRDDRAEIINALVAADPTGPAPENDSKGGVEPDDNWEPIRLGSLPPAEPFPIDVLPPAARDLALESVP